MGIEVVVPPMGSNKGCTIEGEVSLAMGAGGVTFILLGSGGPIGRGSEVGVAIIVPVETVTK